MIAILLALMPYILGGLFVWSVIEQEKNKDHDNGSEQ